MSVPIGSLEGRDSVVQAPIARGRRLERVELVDLPNGFASLFADGASSEGCREDSML